MARRSGPLRALSSVSLIGVLVLLPGIFLCTEEVGPMDEAGAMVACEEPEMNGQQSGVPAPHTPVSAPPPGPAMAAAASAADMPTPSLIRVFPATGPAAAPAAIQGVGFFNLS